MHYLVRHDLSERDERLIGKTAIALGAACGRVRRAAARRSDDLEFAAADRRLRPA
jgi:hypothetical protein